MRWLLLVSILLLAPASASAATLGELAPFELAGDDCVGATGVQGEIVSGTETGVRFLRATRAGIVPGSEVKLKVDQAGSIINGYFSCYTVNVQANGAGVIVGSVNGDLVAVVRDPGAATWSAPQTIVPYKDGESPGNVSAAVSERGDVLLAWGIFGADDRRRFRFARRAPGGRFGTAAAVPASGELGGVKAALAGDGEAFLAWTALEGSKPPLRVPVWVSSAPPGGAFGAPARVLETRLHGGPAFAVAADGRALVVGWDGSSVLVAERAPGAAFGPATPVGSVSGVSVVASAALASGGAAAILLESELAGDALVISRAAGGSFSAPVVAAAGASVVPSGVDPFFLTESYALANGFIDPPYFSDGPPAPRLTDDGRAVVAVPVRSWVSKTTRVAHTLATVPLGTAAVSTSSVAPQFSDDEPVPLLLDDGTPALSWTDTDDPSTFYASKPYRLHVAAEGIAEPPDPPAPRVTIGAPVHRTLGEDGELAVPVRCSAACVVRARVDYALDPIDAVVRLKRAGRGTLTFEGGAIVAPIRRGPARIHLSYGAPGALHPLERTVTVSVSRTVRFPPITAVRARRTGDTVRVTWRVVPRAYEGAEYFVSGAATRDAAGEPLVTRAIEHDKPRRTFTVTLRRARDVRWVTVRSEVPIGPGAQSIVVRVPTA